MRISRKADSYTLSLILIYNYHKQRSEKAWAAKIRQQAKVLEAKSEHKQFRHLCKGIRKNKCDAKVLQCLAGLEVRYFEAEKLGILL